MVLHPAIISLLVSSLIVSFMVLYSASYGIQILRRWDIESGSELQLTLERKTYLISTVLVYVFAIELVSLFLYVFTADALCTLFVGAMCAAGTLNVNSFGYPTLIVKLVNFLLAGLWLIINYADNRGYDYPLIKKKYLLLAAIAPLIVAETVLQGKFFLGLRPDVITSCCGSLFSTDTKGIASEMAGLPSIPMKYLFYSTIALTLSTGVWFYLKGRGGYLFSAMSFLAFPVSIASVISFISLYIYELPTHHCPFCILMKEYGYIGYPLYLSLFAGAVSGLGVGALMPFKSIESLRDILPSLLGKLALSSLISYSAFTALVTYKILVTDFVLEGY